MHFTGTKFAHSMPLGPKWAHPGPGVTCFTCANPESFVRGGPTLTFDFFLVEGMERGSKCH